MQVLVKKWGNSASIRIPAAVMEAAKLSLDQPVDIREEAGRVIIEPIREPVFNLIDLLAAVTRLARGGHLATDPLLLAGLAVALRGD